MRVPLAGLAVLLMSPAYAAAPRTHVVVIDKMKFGPVPKLVRPGDTIIWVNRDLVPHTATSRPGGFDIQLEGGARKKMSVSRAGLFPVVCRYHPGMRTTLKVARQLPR